MKSKRAFLIISVSCLMAAGIGRVCAESSSGRDFPYNVTFELGEAEFAPGDSIAIQSVRGTARSIRPGQSYCVAGTYTLDSRQEADLALFLTTTNAVRARIEPRQTVRVQQGSGTFQLVITPETEGYLHLSYYPAAGGGGFGGVYFGQGGWVLHQKGFSYLKQTAEGEQEQARSSEASPAIPRQNRSILEYLGDPVTAPDRLDPAYTKEGLTAALRLASRNAGVTLRRLEIDDSEFPYLVGFTCGEQDYRKLVEQIKKMEAYEELGGVSTPTCYAINIIPWRAFPSDSSQRIGRRLLLREQMFFDKLSRRE